MYTPPPPGPHPLAPQPGPTGVGAPAQNRPRPTGPVAAPPLEPRPEAGLRGHGEPLLALYRLRGRGSGQPLEGGRPRGRGALRAEVRNR